MYDYISTSTRDARNGGLRNLVRLQRRQRRRRWRQVLAPELTSGLGARAHIRSLKRQIYIYIYIYSYICIYIYIAQLMQQSTYC